jgi:CDP-glucose 4,6-dehydratase
VREAHRDPAATFSTNVMGTLQVLEACRGRAALETLVAFTTDKVYRNDGTGRAFEEDDRLGGSEPYSASKAACDLTIGAYWESYFRASPTTVAVVRAGNIVGGGDWGADRLLPDAIRAFVAGRPLVLRHPDATRPWQHVLDAVRGTLLLAEHDASEETSAEDIAWNLGPPAASETRVADVADIAARAWGEDASWRHERDDAIPEAKRLRLSSGKAAERLGWRCAWDAARSVKESVAWYKAHMSGCDVMDLTERQIAAHVADAR